MQAHGFLGAHQLPNNEELLELAKTFVEIRAFSKAPTTLTKYAKPWAAFCGWIHDLGEHLVPLQSDGALVSLYLAKLFKSSKEDGVGPGRVLTASAAIHCHFVLNGLVSHTSHPACKTVREAAERMLYGKPLNRDEVDATDMKALLDKYAGPDASLRDLMHVTTMLLMFCGFLRFDEAAEISVHEDMLIMTDEMMLMFIPISKTDQHCKGTWIAIPAVVGMYCPVALVKRLLRMGNYKTVPSSQDEDVGPLLRAVKVTKHGYALRQLVGTNEAPVSSLGYSSLLERCKEMCAAVGLEKNITLHSFRIGGASEAIAKGIPDRIVQKQGRWKSECVKNHYVREQVPNMLQVTRALLE